MRKFTTLLLMGMFIISVFNSSAQIFSDIDFYGDTTNYEEANDTLWSLIDYEGDLKYGIEYPKEAGGNRTSIVKEKVLDHNFFVTADVKLFKREQFSAPDEPFWEDAVLFFLYQNDTNYVKAEFFNTNGPEGGRLSGFTVVINDTSYVLKKADAPEDEIEEIPAETCLPFIGDTSFADWNNIEVERVGTILSMLVNGEVYYEIDIDTLTVYQSGASFEAIPQKVIDFLKGSGRVGIGSGNDKIYFDNVDAGYVNVEGEFSNIPGFGEAANYAEANSWLWDVIEEDGDTRYGIVAPKESGGDRKSIYNNDSYGHDFYVEADVKLFKRAAGPADSPWWEDAILYFCFENDSNYAFAEFFNTHGPVTGAGGDAYGLSGFNVVVDGVRYKMKKGDAPEDAVEEIPAETCIPFVGDTSFADWNNLKVIREGSILSMYVNDEAYFSIDADTLSMAQTSGATIDTVPAAAIAILKGSGKIGIGSGNDKVYFDNVKTGYVEIEGTFSDETVLGDAVNYSEANPWLWDVIEEDGDMRYGIVAPKEDGGNRMTILKDGSYGHDFYVEADAKLFKRAAGPADSPWWEDAILYFSYIDDKNYAFAEFFNTHGPATGTGGDAYGLSGFNVVVDGVRYKMKKGDAPEDAVEEIPAETCIPFVGDTSFADWNNLKVIREGSILTMYVNDEAYFSIDADTLSMAQTSGANIEEVPAAVIDILKGTGSIGVGSGNDKVYFDNIKAGYIEVEGMFSDIPMLGDAANYSEVNPWLWDVVDDAGDMRYGIVAPKEDGGNRRTILKNASYGHDFYVEADAKLFKRAAGAADSPWWEDAILFFNYTDDKNYAFAEFFNTHGPVTGTGGDAYGLSGFNVVVDGVRYKMKKGDAPEDEVEEILAETCIPFVDDNSFNDWNKIKVMREGSILSMYVNDNAYFSIDIDTLTMVQTSGATVEVIPAEVIDILNGSGSIGVGSGNDKVYFDNINAGYITVEGIFSDVPVLGDAVNYTEVNPWLWSVVEDGGDMRYGIVAPKEDGGNRMTILDEESYAGDIYVEADAKLFKRAAGSANSSWWEDAIIYFSYVDSKNYAFAEFFNTHGPVTGTGGDAYGLSGFNVVVDGVRYKMKKGDAPEDVVEEIPAETCIPFVDDNSFNDWNNLKVAREGSILTMYVNGEAYFSIDADTLSMTQTNGATIEAVPAAAKDILKGAGKVGLGSGNDKVYFDNVMAGILSSDVTVSDIAFKASTIDGFTAGALEDQYTVTIAVADTAYISDSLVIVPNDASSMVEIISITSDIQETSGTYTVEFKVVSTNGTEETSSIVFDFTIVGIEEFSTFGYKLYPNPVQDVLRIENISDVSRIEVFGLTGQAIMTVETNGRNSIELNTSGLNSGVYFVKAYSSQNAISIAKILKK